MTADVTVARKVLGDELAGTFQSLVSDMKDAMFLNEMPEPPTITSGNDGVRLSFRLTGDVFLDARPVANGSITVDNCGDVHRIKLVNVHQNGQVLA